jgi:hypothetical protein
MIYLPVSFYLVKAKVERANAVRPYDDGSIVNILFFSNDALPNICSIFSACAPDVT